MPANPIIDYLQRESGRIVGEMIYRDKFPLTPWTRLMPRAEWPKGMGWDLTNVTFERTAPTKAEHGWSQVQQVDGTEGGLCLPAAEQVPIGSTTRTFYLYRNALRGPDFCAVDMLADWQLEQQLNGIANAFGDYVREEWELLDRQVYFENVTHKVVCTNTCPAPMSSTGLTTWSAVLAALSLSDPTLSILTQGHLSYVRQMLARDGALGMGMESGAPVLTLICTEETSDGIIRSNGETRNDIRWGAPNLLLAPLGVVGSYRGFYHLFDMFPRRASISGATVTIISPFSNTNATKGIRSEVNTTWRTATVEESHIFDPKVMTQLIPNAIVNPHPKFPFDPVSYVGDINTLNILHEEKNPLGTILFHRADMMASSMPVLPRRGASFLHLRCDPACLITTSCAT